MADYTIGDMRRAVTAMHGCTCAHVGSSVVHEEMDGQTVWNGVVETFTLEGHPKATQAYGIAWDDHGEVKYLAVLNVPPIVSPREAVQAVIAAGKLR
jgi:hypothetical protein